MYNKTVLSVFEQVCKHPRIHQRELAKKIGVSLPSVQHAIKKLNNLFLKKRTGNQLQYTLDYTKTDLTPLFYESANKWLNAMPANVRFAIQDFVKSLEQKPLLVLLFGSYARGDYNEDSDVDMLLVYQQLRGSQRIEVAAERIALRTGVRISPVYLSYKIFEDSFHQRKKPFFKNIRRDAIPLIGAEWWRLLHETET
ncbi:winged helix-turn-helix transcriptional regulator [Candidatus Woesearchaeota archaeon]|nr:winged helix-turn-helix transcriptional regulator [Candidatus Woesearchaeota archaeon]